MDPAILFEIRRNITSGEERLAVLEKDLFDARRAGLEVEATEKQVQDLKSQLRRLREVYGR